MNGGNPTDNDAQAGEQLKLSSIEEAFHAHGVEELPFGFSSLTKKERTFVLQMLEHGQMARAAIEAGYSEKSAGAIASETLRKPKVFEFYRKCVESVASKGELLTRRVYERSVILHAKAIEAAQTVADADAWLLNIKRDEESTKNSKEVREYEQKRERAMRTEKLYVGLANSTDALLGQLIGKLQGLVISGELKHTHEGGMEMTLPSTALDALAQVRREVVTHTRGQKTINFGGGN